MNYDLYITGFKNNRSKKVIARQLANHPSISLQKAIEIIEKPPFIFLNWVFIEKPFLMETLKCIFRKDVII